MATNSIRKHLIDIVKTKKSLSYSDLPGPQRYPLIGNVLGYKTKDGRRYKDILVNLDKVYHNRDPDKTLEIWRDLNDAYGSLVRLDVPGREPTVLVFDPHVAEQVNRESLDH